jgi:hypothetical protein
MHPPRLSCCYFGIAEPKIHIFIGFIITRSRKLDL